MKFDRYVGMWARLKFHDAHVKAWERWKEIEARSKPAGFKNLTGENRKNKIYKQTAKHYKSGRSFRGWS